MREVEKVSLPEAQRAVFKEQLSGAGSPYDDLEGFLTSIYPVFPHLPREILEKLRAFGNDPRSPGVLCLDNLPIDDEIPETPTRPGQDTKKATYVSEGSLLGVAQILGEPLGYYHERNGDVIQNLAPIEAESSSTSSDSSEIDLGFHTDLDFEEDRLDRPFNVTNADYILLLCLRRDPRGEAYTLYVDARDLCAALTRDQIEILRQPLFEFGAAYTFTGKCGEDRVWSVPTPILHGPESYPEITVEMACGVRGISTEAEAVLNDLTEVFQQPEVAQEVVLEPGQLLLINNRKGAHARSAFAAGFDGKDRWLQRLYVRRSLWELRRDGNPARRVFF